MKNYKEFLNEELKDKEFRDEYNSLNTEYDVIKTIINARMASKLTQKDLAIRSGIDQSDISKIECGESNPTVKTLDRLARAMNMKLKIEFVSNNALTNE